MSPSDLIRKIAINTCLWVSPIFLVGQGLTIQSGSQLNSTGATYLVLQDGKFINNGTFTPNSGTVKFVGTSQLGNTTIEGSTTSSFYNIELNKSVGGLQLNTDVIIQNRLLLSSGDSLFLNGRNITLSSTGLVIGEIENLRITGLTGGYIAITKSLSSPSNDNLGNLGLSITTAANLGTVSVKRFNQRKGNVSISRYFEVTPANNTGLNASLVMSYFDHELGSVNEANLAYYTNVAPSSLWTLKGLTASDAIANTVSMTGFASLDNITLADLNLSSFLPVKFLDFTATPLGKHVQLKWTTTYEERNDHFALEHSSDSKNYTSFATIKANNSQSKSCTYSFIDNSPYTGINFYRIKQIDIDGKFEYSKTAIASIDLPAVSDLKIYPNPTKSEVSILVTDNSNSEHYIRIYNSNGLIALTMKYNTIPGTNVINLNTVSLARGLYQVIVEGGGKIRSSKFVKL